MIVTAAPAPQTVDLTAHADDVWQRMRLGFAIPNLDSPRVVEQQAWYLSHQEFLQRAVERSSHYLYHVLEELEKRHMPTELALLPFVESAYNPMATSRARASGMWQFIPQTGKNYSLKQDWWKDERRDVVASTDAALNYLGVLYQDSGDWTIALASYNWGEGAVKRAIARNQAAGLPTDYESLDMPEETRNYFPKLQALKNIISDPDKYGISLPHIGNEPYFVAVPRTRTLDMRTAARMADMTLAEFKELNPAFNRAVMTGPDRDGILLPADRVAVFQAQLQAHPDNGPSWGAYRVKRGDRLERIAARYGMTEKALREANGLAPNASIRPGQALLVQTRPARHAHAEPVEHERMLKASLPAPALAAVGRHEVRIRRGDTLSAIARREGVTVAQLRAENHVSGPLKVGALLVIPERS